MEQLEDRTVPSASSGLGLFDHHSGVPVHKAKAHHHAKVFLRDFVALDSTTLMLRFKKKLGKGASDPASYNIPGLTVIRVSVAQDKKTVFLTTTPLTADSYTVTIAGVKTSAGQRLSSSVNTMHVSVPPALLPTPADTTPPRVTGAVSLDNNTVLVAFNEPMADNAINPAHYFIVQQNVNPEVGFVPVQGAAFNSADHRSVLLTTASQNEVTYSVTAVNVTDLAGNPLAPVVIVGGLRSDPSTATFPGTPASGTEIVDTDHDGLSDNVEVRGYTVTVTLSGGSQIIRQVTSDPNNPDTDSDSLSDAQELRIGTDPRRADTDGDQLNDYAEFNQIFSDPTKQDTDGDGPGDNSEFTFYHTAPFRADTDGDQIPDGAEILANRNPLVSDLPRPEISVGDVNLQLNVHFTETNAKQTQDLETQNISTTFNMSNSQKFTNQYTAALEAKLAFGTAKENGASFLSFEADAGFTYQRTDESATVAEQTYNKSLQTSKEVTRGFTVQREVTGAVMQVAVSLRNLSNLAYRVQNLQVTAFIQDPLDHSKLTPLATLVPDSEPANGFTLGPLVTNRGPFIFSNTTIVPTLVESLMANASGLVFRIANYDIIDEAGRNFAFTSQDVVERTSQLVIDYGGASSLRAQVSGNPIDENAPGDETEIHRVATSIGRPIADTNSDGKIDVAPRELFDAQGNSLGIDSDGDGVITPADATYVRDTPVIFDGTGKEVGISVFKALAVAGLTRYDEATTPTANLSVDQILNSYSTFFDVASNREKIFRIRGVSNDNLNQKFWEILTPTGIDQFTDLNDLILKAGSGVSLNFVQDLDGDGLPADVEYFLRTSDSPTPAGTAVPDSTDTTNETVTFVTDPNLATGNLVHVSADGGGLMADVHYYIHNLGAGSYSFYNSLADAVAGTAAGRIDLTDNITAVVGVPAGRDTDKEGLDDRFEALIGWTVTTPLRTYPVYSSPNRADSNFDAPAPGVDGNANGIEDRLEYDSSDAFAAPAGWNDKNHNSLRDRFEVFQTGPSDYVLDPIRKDTDGDGLNDATEIIGFKIVRITDGSIIVRSTNPLRIDTDGDTFSDGFERQVGLDPTDGTDKDTDGDGLPDPVETNGWTVTTFGVSTTPYVQDFTQKAVPTSTDTTNDKVAFGTDPNLATGTLVQVLVTGGGLAAGNNYFIRNLGSGSYSFYDSAAAALGGTDQGPIDLTANVQAVIVGHQATRMSNPNSVDSDGDGLTDFEEFFLSTDPKSRDTDSDGISDLLELKGYTLPHDVGGKNLGIIKTDPLDADSDDDLRSDGAEAELQDIELNRWIVSVKDQAPDRVYSNPLVADADFDRLVDGQEFAIGTDPNNGNTDDDSRDDGKEVTAHTNPLAPDFQVTVFISSIVVGKSGDTQPDPGEWGFDIGVRKPDNSQPAGLSSTLFSIVQSNVQLVAPFQSQRVADTGSWASSFEALLPSPDLNNGSWSGTNQNFDSSGFGVPLNNGETLSFKTLPANMHSISFGMTNDDSFAIEGVLEESDGGDYTHDAFVYLGGLEGVRATVDGGSDPIRPVFLGSDLLAAKSNFHDLTFTFTEADTISNEDKITGTVTMFFFVSP